MRRYTIEIAGERHVIDVEELTLERFQVRVGDRQFEVRLTADENLGGVTITPLPPSAPAELPPAAPAPQAAAPAPVAPREAAGSHAIVAPMPGVVLSVAVTPGQRVEAGQAVLTLEAMKMQNTLRAPRAGTVAAVLVQAGQQVAFGVPLVQLAEVTP